jgi:hypothetical protein
MATAKRILLSAVATGALALVAVLTMPKIQQKQIEESPIAVLAGTLFSGDPGGKEFAWDAWARRTDAERSRRNYQLAFAVLLGVISANLAVAAGLKLASKAQAASGTE